MLNVNGNGNSDTLQTYMDKLKAAREKADADKAKANEAAANKTSAELSSEETSAIKTAAESAENAALAGKEAATAAKNSAVSVHTDAVQRWLDISNSLTAANKILQEAETDEEKSNAQTAIDRLTELLKEAKDAVDKANIAKNDAEEAEKVAIAAYDEAVKNRESAENEAQKALETLNQLSEELDAVSEQLETTLTSLDEAEKAAEEAQKAYDAEKANNTSNENAEVSEEGEVINDETAGILAEMLGIEPETVKEMADEITKMAEGKDVSATDYVSARLVDFLAMRAENPDMTVEEMNEQVALKNISNMFINNVSSTYSNIFGENVESINDLLEMQTFALLDADYEPDLRNAYMSTSELIYMQLAKNGDLTNEQYHSALKNDLTNLFPQIGNLNESEFNQLSANIDKLDLNQVKELINKCMALPSVDDQNYDIEYNKFLSEFNSAIENSTFSGVENPDEKIDFKSIYMEITGVDFNADDIIEYNNIQKEVENYVDATAVNMIVNNIAERVENGELSEGDALWQMAYLYTGSNQEDNILEFLQDTIGLENARVENGTVIIEKPANTRGTGNRRAGEFDEAEYKKAKKWADEYYQKKYNSSTTDRLVETLNKWGDAAKYVAIGTGTFAIGAAAVGAEPVAAGAGVMAGVSGAASALFKGGAATIDYFQKLFKGTADADDAKNYAYNMASSSAEFGVNYLGLGLINNELQFSQKITNTIENNISSYKNFSNIRSSANAGIETGTSIDGLKAFDNTQNLTTTIDGIFTQATAGYRIPQGSNIYELKNIISADLDILSKAYTRNAKTDEEFYDGIFKLINIYKKGGSDIEGDVYWWGETITSALFKYGDKAECRHLSAIFKSLSDNLGGNAKLAEVIYQPGIGTMYSSIKGGSTVRLLEFPKEMANNHSIIIAPLKDGSIKVYDMARGIATKCSAELLDYAQIGSDNVVRSAFNIKGLVAPLLVGLGLGLADNANAQTTPPDTNQNNTNQTNGGGGTEPDRHADNPYNNPFSNNPFDDGYGNDSTPPNNNDDYGSNRDGKQSTNPDEIPSKPPQDTPNDPGSADKPNNTNNSGNGSNDDDSDVNNNENNQPNNGNDGIPWGPGHPDYDALYGDLQGDNGQGDGATDNGNGTSTLNGSTDLSYLFNNNKSDSNTVSFNEQTKVDILNKKQSELNVFFGAYANEIKVWFEGNKLCWSVTYDNDKKAEYDAAVEKGELQSWLNGIAADSSNDTASIEGGGGSGKAVWEKQGFSSEEEYNDAKRYGLQNSKEAYDYIKTWEAMSGNSVNIYEGDSDFATSFWAAYQLGDDALKAWWEKYMSNGSGFDASGFGNNPFGSSHSGGGSSVDKDGIAWNSDGTIDWKNSGLTGVQGNKRGESAPDTDDKDAREAMG